MAPTDTIVAVSSPPGRSSRGLIRISGPDAHKALDRLLESHGSEPREITAVRFRRPPIPALLLRFESPASYTGDDLAELQLAGNPALIDRVVQQTIATPDASIRLAEPGEFTFRAYTAGKLDLTQAEGVGATIAAVSDSQLAAARLLREGKLGQASARFVDRLGNLLALVEAGIDFTDQDDVNPIAPRRLKEKIDALIEDIDQLLSRSRSWGALESLPRVVLVGPPSAGKSTLFNALLNRERAVIDATPGTTRDALLEPLRLSARNGRAVEAMLVDLAGLDELHGAGDQGRPAPDHEAQRIAHDAIRQADLLLRVADDPHTFVNVSSSAPTIDLQTKADLQKNLGPAVVSSDADLDRHGVLRISAITGEGLDTLRTAIVNALAEKAVSVQADLLALQPRHEQAIGDAVSALRDTQALLAPAASDSHLHDIELLANTMRTALDALASLGGQLTPDEVIGRVFATFCVGK